MASTKLEVPSKAPLFEIFRVKSSQGMDIVNIPISKPARIILDSNVVKLYKDFFVTNITT